MLLISSYRLGISVDGLGAPTSNIRVYLYFIAWCAVHAPRWPRVFPKHPISNLVYFDSYLIRYVISSLSSSVNRLLRPFKAIHPRRTIG